MCRRLSRRRPPPIHRRESPARPHCRKHTQTNERAEERDTRTNTHRTTHTHTHTPASTHTHAQTKERGGGRRDETHELTRARTHTHTHTHTHTRTRARAPRCDPPPPAARVRLRHCGSEDGTGPSRPSVPLASHGVFASTFAVWPRVHLCRAQRRVSTPSRSRRHASPRCALRCARSVRSLARGALSTHVGCF
jgi:hypothetical protein